MEEWVCGDVLFDAWFVGRRKKKSWVQSEWEKPHAKSRETECLRHGNVDPFARRDGPDVRRRLWVGMVKRLGGDVTQQTWVSHYRDCTECEVHLSDYPVDVSCEVDRSECWRFAVFQT
jgi:hypothetical protein